MFEEWYKKNKERLVVLGKALDEYLAMEKIFIPNPERFEEVKTATQIAEKLFSRFKIEVTNDPLQSGALVITIKGTYIDCSGERQIKDFQQLIAKANNFEILPLAAEKFEFSLMFDGALKRV